MRRSADFLLTSIAGVIFGLIFTGIGFYGTLISAPGLLGGAVALGVAPIIGAFGAMFGGRLVDLYFDRSDGPFCFIVVYRIRGTYGIKTLIVRVLVWLIMLAVIGSWIYFIRKQSSLNTPAYHTQTTAQQGATPDLLRSFARSSLRLLRFRRRVSLVVLLLARGVAKTTTTRIGKMI